MTTKSRDMGYDAALGAWREFNKAPKGIILEVGIFKESTTQDGTASLASIYATHEFGGGRVPARPTLRPTVDRNGGYRKKVSEAAAAINTGQLTPMEALIELGETIAGDVKQAITDLKSPGLAPSTLRKRMKKRHRRTANAASRKYRKARSAGARLGAAVRYAASMQSLDNPLVDTGWMRQNIDWRVRV